MQSGYIQENSHYFEDLPYSQKGLQINHCQE